MAPEIKVNDYLEQTSVEEKLEGFIEARRGRLVEEVINIEDDKALQIYLISGEPLVVLVAGRRHIWGTPRVEKIIASTSVIQKLQSAGIILSKESEIVKMGTAARTVKVRKER